METREIQIESLEKEIRNYVVNISDTKSDITLWEFLSDKLLTIKALERGLPVSISVKILDVISPIISSGELKFITLFLTPEKANDNLDPLDTEKIMELAEVVEFGRKVFENDEKLKLWLDTPIKALGYIKPMTLLKYNSGRHMVIEELGRIEYGIFA